MSQSPLNVDQSLHPPLNARSEIPHPFKSDEVTLNVTSHQLMSDSLRLEAGGNINNTSQRRVSSKGLQSKFIPDGEIYLQSMSMLSVALLSNVGLHGRTIGTIYLPVIDHHKPRHLVGDIQNQDHASKGVYMSSNGYFIHILATVVLCTPECGCGGGRKEYTCDRWIFYFSIFVGRCAVAEPQIV